MNENLESMPEFGSHLLSLQKFLAPYPGAYSTAMVVALLLISLLLFWLTRQMMLHVVHRVLSRITIFSESTVNRLISQRVARSLAYIIPILVVEYGLHAIPHLPARLMSILDTACNVGLVVVLAMTLSHAIDLANTLYERRPGAHHRPIKGFLQVVKIIIYVFAVLSAMATLSGVKIGHIITGLGAVTAVLILVFQDTLLSLVASVQISSDSRVRIGDWIQMPAFDVDGAVVDIALHSITVRNWDMAVVTVPTKRLISDSFKNWRGMIDCGGRRIKAPLYVDQRTVRFLEESELSFLSKMRFFKGYSDARTAEIEIWEKHLGTTEESTYDLFRVTNLDAFRFYATQYLQHHPRIRQDMLIMVRQLQASSEGMPVELWCFTNRTDTLYYERVQSEIFSHLLAVLPRFGLRAFQVASDSSLSRKANILPIKGFE